MKSKTHEHLLWFGLGVSALLFTKYIFFGLDDWNTILHKGRIEPSSTPEYLRQGLIISELDKQLIKIQKDREGK